MLPRSSNFKSSRCACCGVEAECIVCCSAFGSFSFAACASCIEARKEPYRNMVNYISSAGHWPDDINAVYQSEVRRQLRLHDIPEAVFKFEVDRAIADERAFISQCCEEINLEEILFGGGDLF